MERLKTALKSKKVLLTLIVITTLIIIGLIYFLTVVYTKDKPAFVPEETKGEIRKGVDAVIVTPLEKVVPNLAKNITDAKYGTPTSVSGGNNSSVDPYKNWQTYKNEELGFELRHPEDITIESSFEQFEDYKGSITFWDSIKKSLPFFEIDIFLARTPSITADEWLKENNIPNGVISGINPIIRGSNEWLSAIEAGDPDHIIYVIKKNGYFYKIKTMDGTNLDYVLESFKS